MSNAKFCCFLLVILYADSYMHFFNKSGPCYLKILYILIFPATHCIFNLFFNWRKITLQCCVCFCCTTMQINHNYIYIYPLPLELPTPKSSRLCSLWYIKISKQLSILHMIVYIVNATFSIHPTLLPHCVYKSVLYIFISITSLKKIHQYHFSLFCILIS